jgi:hypothetical protein
LFANIWFYRIRLKVQSCTHLNIERVKLWRWSTLTQGECLNQATGNNLLKLGQETKNFLFF